MFDPDLHTWDTDTARLERDAEVDSSEDHYRTVFFGFRDNRFFSKPACGCGFTTEFDAALVAHLRRKLNP